MSKTDIQEKDEAIREPHVLGNKGEGTITLKFVSGEEEIFIEDIIYISSANRILEFHVRHEAEPFKIYRKLNDMQKELDDLCPNTFIRIHQRDLINARYVEDIKGRQVIMQGGVQLDISKSRKVIDIKRALNSFRL
jgi:DNA-binding LytR/AlgR family response regulator